MQKGKGGKDQKGKGKDAKSTTRARVNAKEAKTTKGAKETMMYAGHVENERWFAAGRLRR